MYTDDFKKAVHKDIIKRMDEDKNFELEVDNLCQTLGEDKTRNLAYEEYAKKPEFKQYLEEKGTFSQFFEDMSNTGKAWDSGDFLGHFQSIARSGMTGDYKSQELAYQNYKKWAEANPQPEGKTWLGKIALGVANQLNLMGDMQPEALATGLATGGTFAGIASATNAVATPVIGAPTTLGAGVLGFKTGYGASNLKQGYEIGYADAYTALRDEGIDQETANSIAGKVAVPYALLELLKLKHIPGVRKLVGGKTIADILKNIADDKIKNKAIRAFTKKGVDLGVATAVGTATEVAQRAMTEIPKYPAKNESVQWGDVANAMVEEGKAVLPAMIGTAGLGSVVEHVATRPSKLEKDIARVNEAIEEGKQILDEKQKQKQAKVQKKNVVDIPADVKPGEDFIGPDGKKYRNVDGIAMPVIVVGEDSTNNLDADAESEKVEPVKKEETKQEEVKKAYSNPLTKIELPPVATEESKPKTAQDIFLGNLNNFTPPEENVDLTTLAGNRNVQQNVDEWKNVYLPQGKFDAQRTLLNKIENDPYNVPAGEVNVPLPAYIQKVQQQLEAQAKLEEAKRKQAEEDAKLDELAEEDVAYQQLEQAKQRTAKAVKKYKRLSDSDKAFNAEKKELRKILDSIPDEDVATKLEVIDSVEDLALFDDKDLDYALSHGREWALTEMQDREARAEESKHETILDVMARNGYTLPTPKAIKEKGGSGDLYGEVKDLHDNLYQAGGKGRHYLQKFFRDRYVSIDDLVQILNTEEGFSYSSSDEFLRDLADNFAGVATTRSNYSLAPKGKNATTTDNAKLEKVKRAIEKTKRQFYKNAHHKANVTVLSGAELERMTGKLGARGSTGKRTGNIYIAGDKMEDAKEGVRIMLHEYVGHFGLKRLLGADLKPFVAYIKKKYEGTAEWNKLKEAGYAEEDIAEEMIAHLAEYRHLSDPSMLNRSIAGGQHMWNVLVNMVRKALKKEGISDTYAKLLDEDTLKSAVRLSRQYAKGDLVMNDKGVWESLNKTKKSKDVPDDDKEEYNLSLSPKDKYQELEKKHFGPEARNGNFDLNNIDLENYYGMDTRSWTNEDWAKSWDWGTQIEHVTNSHLNIMTFLDMLGRSKREDVLISTGHFDILEDYIYDIKDRNPRSDFSGLQAKILSLPHFPMDYVGARAHKLRFNIFFFYSYHKDSSLNPQEQNEKLFELLQSVDEYTKNNGYERLHCSIIHNILEYIYDKKKAPQELIDLLIEACRREEKNKTEPHPYRSIYHAIESGYISDDSILKIINEVKHDNALCNVLGGFADNSIAFNVNQTRAIENRITNGTISKELALALKSALRERRFYNKLPYLKNTIKRLYRSNHSIISDKDELSDFIIENIPQHANKKVDYITQRMPAQDLRDSAYYEALDSGDMAKADAIIKERQLEAGYDTDVTHTTKSDDIRTFKLDRDLAKKNGENVQAFGYGGYTAENEKTRQFYYDKFTWELDQSNNKYELKIEKNGKYIKANLSEKKKFIENYIDDKAQTSNYKLGRPTATSYYLGHKMKDDEMLLWDKPLTEQNEKVQEKLHAFFSDVVDEDTADELIFENYDGHGEYDDLMTFLAWSVFKDLENGDFIFRSGRELGSIYKELEDIVGPVTLNKALQEYGIKGIKLLDGNSRGKNKTNPTYNYVSFDPAHDLKRRDTITHNKKGEIIPPSLRFNPKDEDWNFSLINENNKDENGNPKINLDVVDENRGEKISVLLAKAKDRYKKGESKQEIFKATGWELMDVGKDEPEWIYDLDEGKVDFVDVHYGYADIGFESPLEDNITNKKLFEVCPFLKDVKVVFETLPSNDEYGDYNPELKLITINEALKLRQMKKTLMHEIQHAIDIENYTGANPDDLNIIISLVQIAKDMADDVSCPNKIRNEANEFYKEVVKTYKLTDEELSLEGKELIELAFNKYQAHVGEMMARNAEKRYLKRNRNKTLISDTIDKTDEKIYITESNSRKLLDWADSFSKMAFDYENGNSKSKRHSKIRSIVERLDSKIRKSKTKTLPRRSTYMEEDGFNYSLQDRDELDAKHKDLYERYKEGDKEAYEEAVELVKAEAERKGYAVKVYHGTKSDKFNIADATSSHEENGEGAQAHGAGLYMAVSRNTAEDYQRSNIPSSVYDYTTIVDRRTKDELGFSDVSDVKWNVAFNKVDIGIDYLIEDYTRKIKKLKSAQNKDEKEIAEIESELQLYKRIKSKGLHKKDIRRKYTKGNLFDWFTNLNDDNTLDADKPLSEQSEGVRRAILEYYKSRPDDYIIPNGIDDLDAYQNGKRFYKDVAFQMRREGAKKSKLEASKLLASLGIKGLTYYGESDGRCYVSFEGGSAVKLQDPFTFNDNGELIPLSERFDSSNEDMNYSLDPNAKESETEESKPREKYDGRYGRAQRKYTKLLGQKRNELGRHVEYDELPDLTTDDEFKSVVGMTKKEYAELMQERDKVANEMRYEYQKTGQKFKQAQIDRYNPIKIIERIINGGDLLGAEKSAYKSLFTAGNMDEVMYNAIYVGLPQYDRKSGTYKIRKGYKPLIQYFEKVKGDKYDNFQNYAQAVAMLEHYARSHNLETIEDALEWADSKEFEEMAGFSKAEAKKWIEEATQDSKDTVDALQELFRANREFMVETGLASAKQAEVLNSFEYYLPMLRQFEDADTILSGDGGGFKSRGFSGRSSGVKEFVGSKAKIKNVMESIIERTASLYANGYKNVAMQRNIQMLSEFGLAKHSAKASVRVQARIEQAKNALEREGIKVEGVRDESELIPLEAFHIINSIDEQIRDNIVSVRSNGNLIFYHIADPELLVALKSLGAEQQKLITTLFTKAKNVMTWGVTKLPAFAVRNFLRDTGGNAIILGNNPAKSVVNFAKSIKDTPQMQSIRMSGMGGASWYPVSATGATLDFGKGSLWKKAKRVGKYILTPFKAYDRILQASEQANRISAYDKAIAEGLSEAEASFRASDVLNFGMRGSGVWTGKNYYAKSAMEILSWLIRISPFVNAGIQGLFKAYREAGFEKGFFDAKDEFSKKAKAKKVMQAMNKSLLIRGAILAGASVLYSIYANNSEDDDGEKWYEKLSDDEKLSYWHFYMGDNKILRVPKPFEIGYLFSTIPTAMTDAMLQDNPETAKLLWRGMTDQLRFDFASNPIIDTAIENWRNKDSFRKTPIVERSDLNLPSQMQYSADTTSTAKALSIIPNMIPLLRDTWASSPARVQNMMDNFFGGMSQYGTYITDAIVESFSSIEGGTSRYARTSPLTKAYDWSMRDTRTMRYKNAEKFYELKGRIDELYASARVYKQSQQLDKLQELLDENKAEFGNYEIVNALNTKLNEIATKRRKLGSTKTYSTEELIELDDKLLAERNKLLNYTDLIIERLEAGKYDERDLRAIIKRIENAGKTRKESRKADNVLRSLK